MADTHTRVCLLQPSNVIGHNIDDTTYGLQYMYQSNRFTTYLFLVNKG